jgi:3-oxoacyl-(acyl-carrier-protein) synthase
MLSYTPSTAVAAHHQLRGPCLTIATGCSAGADALGQAFWHIQEGRADRILAGGSDSALSVLGLSVFSVMHALSTNNEEPQRASRPYDAQRDGFVLAEGAAVLLLEEHETALARGAHIYAEFQAFATNSSAYHMVTLPKAGTPLQALLRQVLHETQISSEQIGYINSHGSSTLPNDVAETVAYKQVFGSQAYEIPISSTKSLIGHTQGAASAIEALVTALALDQQTLPPTINLETADPDCDLDYVANVARPVDPEQPLQLALTHSSGFGGINTALVLAKHGRETNISERRVVVTGLGVVAPNGIGQEAFWQALSAGRSALGPPARYNELGSSSRFVGEVKDFSADAYLDRKLAQRTDRMTHFVLTAVQEALRDAQLTLEQEDPQRIGAVIANTLGGVEYVTQQLARLYELGPRFISAHTALAWLHVANVGRASVHYGLQGYCKVPVNDTCGGLDALGLAYQAIRRGTADILLAGGTEAPLHPCPLQILQALPPFQGESNSYRPFDLGADGLLMAEGAGICILEEYEHALQRGAHIYGEIVGYAQTCGPGELNATPAQPDARAYIQALQLALTEASLQPEEIGCVFLDGRASPTWDALETVALREVFGPEIERLPCSVPRTQFGHSIAAAGALDSICALLTLQKRCIPPTLNCEEPDMRTCPPGLVRGEAQIVNMQSPGELICARGSGGSHVVLAIKQNV